AQLRAIADESSADVRQDVRQQADLRIDARGSGSDFTPFLQHVGLATLNLGFGREGGGGIYHSIYDDHKRFTSLQDTSLAYGRGRPLREGAHQGAGGASLRTRQARGPRSQRYAAANRARAHEPRGAATARLVSPPDLRPGVLYRLRCEDAARRTRGHRAEALAGGRRADRRRFENARRRR